VVDEKLKFIARSFELKTRSVGVYPRVRVKTPFLFLTRTTLSMTTPLEAYNATKIFLDYKTNRVGDAFLARGIELFSACSE
jgi:hypothetical protein